MRELANVCLAMPCRNVPHPRAFKAVCAVSSRNRIAYDTPAAEPRERNRNNVVAGFLEHKQFDWLLFVDDDTVIPEDAAEKLIDVGKPFVTGVQPLMLPSKDEAGAFHYVANVMRFPTAEHRTPHWPDWFEWKRPSTPFRVFHCGFGCVLLSREVLESIGFPWFREDYGDQWNRNAITEDIYFCDRARRAGFDIWCEPSVVCGHYKTVDLLDVVPRSRINWAPTVGEIGPDDPQRPATLDEIEQGEAVPAGAPG